MRKFITITLAIIGVFSGFISIVQFFRVGDLPRISGVFSLCPMHMRKSERFLDVLQEINAHVGELIFLDLYIDSKCSVYSDGKSKRVSLTFPRRINEEEESVSYDFTMYQIARNFPSDGGGVADITKIRRTSKANYVEIDEQRIASRFLSDPNKDMLPLLMSDNGATITFYNDSLQINPYSRINIGVEGSEDQIYGVYHIKESYLDANHNFIIGPPAIDSGVMKQAKCATKQWSVLRKFLQCPFL